MAKPIRKRFETRTVFPFSFVYRDTKSGQRELPDHLHEWYELVYVHGGRGAFFIDQTVYEMRAGDLFAIPGNVIHRAFPDKDDPVTSTAVFFSPILIQTTPLGEAFSYLRCFERARGTGRFKQACSPALQAGIEAALSAIDAELSAAQAGCRHAVTLRLHGLLLDVNRELAAVDGAVAGGSARGERDGGRTTASGGGGDSAFGPAWLRSALPYIDDHLSEEIGLKRLSELAAVSPAHFSRVFKRLTGMNVTGFIAAKRMIRAKELLLAGTDNVATIAAACGFESLPHFHRLFRRFVGMTPAAYRRGREQ